MTPRRIDSKLPETWPSDELAPQVVDVRRFKLEVSAGMDEGKAFAPLGERTLIGREPWCDLVLTDPKVSGQHFEIVVEDGRIRVLDSESTNGTWFGSLRIHDAFVRPDTKLRVGNTTIDITEEVGTHEMVMMSTDPTGSLVGKGPQMRRLFDRMSRVNGRNLPLLIFGETGTGKTATAKAMHHMSRRAQNPFVEADCSALPSEFPESALFGHVKGAFAGASAASVGFLEQAKGGSVLLDEIDSLPFNLQSKLLQALESHRICPVGASHEVETDFRLFATTTQQLPKFVSDARFNRKLYQRIAVVSLAIPPLRERTEDIALLAKLHISRCVGEGQGGWNLGSDAQHLLETQPWPGNVRELNDVVERAVAISDANNIGAEQVRLALKMTCRGNGGANNSVPNG